MDVIREVTHDDNYSTMGMAKPSHKMPEADKTAIKERMMKTKKNATQAKQEKKAGKQDPSPEKKDDGAKLPVATQMDKAKSSPLQHKDSTILTPKELATGGSDNKPLTPPKITTND